MRATCNCVSLIIDWLSIYVRERERERVLTLFARVCLQRTIFNVFELRSCDIRTHVRTYTHTASFISHYLLDRGRLHNFQSYTHISSKNGVDNSSYNGYAYLTQCAHVRDSFSDSFLSCRDETKRTRRNCVVLCKEPYFTILELCFANTRPFSRCLRVKLRGEAKWTF